jgi:UDP-N-acetylglucosamine:LPS N-acetylglucosamine transferase
VKKCDTTKLIAASDVIIAKGSSTLLEASIAGKPVLIYNFSNRPNAFEFKDYAIGPYIDDPFQIPGALRTVLYDVDARKEMKIARKSFITEWADGADGHASMRLADLLKKLAK